jgi:hypothetical protein
MGGLLNGSQAECLHRGGMMRPFTKKLETPSSHSAQNTRHRIHTCSKRSQTARMSKPVIDIMSERAKRLQTADAGLPPQEPVLWNDHVTDWTSESVRSASGMHKSRLSANLTESAFICNLTTDAHSRTRVATIIGLADAFNMTTVTEAVEHQSQCEHLLGVGCDGSQGLDRYKADFESGLLRSQKRPQTRVIQHRGLRLQASGLLRSVQRLDLQAFEPDDARIELGAH